MIARQGYDMSGSMSSIEPIKEIFNRVKPHLFDDNENIFHEIRHFNIKSHLENGTSFSAAYKKVIDDIANADKNYGSVRVLSEMQAKAVCIMLVKRFVYVSVEILPNGFPWSQKVRVIAKDGHPHTIAMNIFTSFKWACNCHSWLTNLGCVELERLQPSLTAIFC